MSYTDSWFINKDLIKFISAKLNKRRTYIIVLSPEDIAANMQPLKK